MLAVLYRVVLCHVISCCFMSCIASCCVSCILVPVGSQVYTATRISRHAREDGYFVVAYQELCLLALRCVVSCRVELSCVVSCCVILCRAKFSIAASHFAICVACCVLLDYDVRVVPCSGLSSLRSIGRERLG